MAQGNGIGGEMSRLDRFEYWVADHTILLIFIFFTFLLLSIAYMPVEFRSGVYPKITEAIKIKESQAKQIEKLNNKIEIIRSMLDGLDKVMKE